MTPIFYIAIFVGTICPHNTEFAMWAVCEQWLNWLTWFNECAPDTETAVK